MTDTNIKGIMKRTIYNQLLKWKLSPSRKPLMLYGARQVGKTYILKQFGSREFDNMIYINCFKNPDIRLLFSQDKDISRILLGLSAISNTKIEPGKTFIFLDEVQEIPDVVSSLKYFNENASDIVIAVAGSLLGVMNLENVSFPTGNVEILHMYPMTFYEFLLAKNETILADLLSDGNNETTINSLLPKYTELLRQYYFVGGMPEAVSDFIANNNPESVRSIQLDILSAYEADIAKHAGRDAVKARMVFQSIPSQLARENKKFIFGALRKGARGSEYENAIQWLVDAGLVYKIARLTKVAMPLKFYFSNDAFKLFLVDVGLLGAMAEVPPTLMLIGNNIFVEFKGAFTENFVLTQMVCVPNTVIGYYSKENSTVEIDFVVQTGEKILPIEVKAETNVKSRSLNQFINVDNAGSGMHGYRLSMMGFDHQSWVDNIPLFATHSFLLRKE